MKVDLKKPVEHNGKTITSIDVREEVLVKDLIAIGDATNDVERGFWLIASLADVPRHVVERQPANWSAMTDEKLLAILGNALSEDGETSPSPSASSPDGPETTSGD
ncbi:MAG: phage tail assembly protein [Devosia sp.]